MSYKDMYDQLLAFESSDGPTDAGETLMGSIAQAVVQEGWASVDDRGRYSITAAGRRVLDELRRGIRG